MGYVSQFNKISIFKRIFIEIAQKKIWRKVQNEKINTSNKKLTKMCRWVIKNFSQKSNNFKFDSSFVKGIQFFVFSFSLKEKMKLSFHLLFQSFKVQKLKTHSKFLNWNWRVTRKVLNCNNVKSRWFFLSTRRIKDGEKW